MTFVILFLHTLSDLNCICYYICPILYVVHDKHIVINCIMLIKSWYKSFLYYSPLICPAVISDEPITPPLLCLPLLKSPRIYIYTFYISISIFYFPYHSFFFFSFSIPISTPFLPFSLPISILFLSLWSPLASCRHPLSIVLSLLLLSSFILLYPSLLNRERVYSSFSYSSYPLLSLLFLSSSLTSYSAWLDSARFYIYVAHLRCI